MVGFVLVPYLLHIQASRTGSAVLFIHVETEAVVDSAVRPYASHISSIGLDSGSRLYIVQSIVESFLPVTGTETIADTSRTAINQVAICIICVLSINTYVPPVWPVGLRGYA